METLGQRLKFAMENLYSEKVKAIKLAKAIGLAQATISDVVLGKSKSMEASKLLLASTFLKVDPYWLALGIGEPKPKQCSCVNLESNFLLKNNEFSRIPLIKLNQFNLIGIEKSEELDCLGYTYFNKSNEDMDSLFSFRVEDDSFGPNFKVNDTLIVNTAIDPKPTNYVVATFDNEVIFRQYKVISYDPQKNEIYELIPLNEFYPTLNSGINQLKILGVLIAQIHEF
jgi:SOS-response transcriptional repressor LexA